MLGYYQLRVIIHIDIIYFALYIPGKEVPQELIQTNSLVTLIKINQSFQLTEYIS